jgi:hypothetical protein
MSQNDTVPIELSERQRVLLGQIEYRKEYAIQELGDLVLATTPLSLSSLKRDIAHLCDLGYLKMEGERRTSMYSLTDYGLLRRPYDVGSYFSSEDLFRKNILTSYNFGILHTLGKQTIFTDIELARLREATEVFRSKGKGSSEALVKKELERFVIELSWKSSKIEGNTYTLLDTERLLRDGIASDSNTKDEATMIINHKKAFAYILDSQKKGINLCTFRELENIHRLLVDGLGINHGLRKNAVGVTGTRYLPLSLSLQIEDEVRAMVEMLGRQSEDYSGALLAILMVSYLQAFEDGNKRTGRLFANAILIGAGLAPLSYRDVDEKEYREAVLIFYEQNSIEAFKKIFIEQYIFSCNTYNLG